MSPYAESNSENHIRSNYKMLVIDDDSTYLSFLQRFFSKNYFFSNYDIECESDDEVAFTKLKSSQYDICLVDYHLTHSTGIELLTRCRKSGCGTAFILLTGRDDEKSVNQALSSGADDYLLKDEISASLLNRSIRYALQRQQTERFVSNQQLKLLETMKMSTLGELTSIVVHEINNPLAAIRGNLLLARQYLEGPKANSELALKKIHQADQSVSRMSTIVQSLRKMTRGKSTAIARTITIQSLIDAAYVVCESRLKLKNISFEINIPEKETQIECVENEILQVLVNLINNSCDGIEKMEDRWIQINIFKEEKKVTILFTDSGGGIPSKIQSDIFQPFFSTKTKDQKTGLGLSICKTIIENHGGSLELDTHSRNTRFIMKLPTRYQEHQVSKSFKVLLVEDHPDIREIIQSQLSLEPIEILTAENGIEALGLLEQQKVDLIITDINMPGLSGVQLIEKLDEIKDRPTPHFIFVTGQPVKDLRDPTGKSVTVFQKPIDFNQLRHYISELTKDA